MNQKKEKAPLIETGFLQALSAVDSQIARAMSKSPQEREVHGIEKWELHSAKFEQISGLLLDMFSDNKIQLDSILVCSQAFSKALAIICEDLGTEGLGEIRTKYIQKACSNLERDARDIMQNLSANNRLM